jgi:16S rRNA (adenine1518-N6/adenine1519-N6)-dimethyltransferase
MKADSRFHPSKRLGQHFLVRPHIIREIVDRARFRKSDRILEVGPGQGALTLSLAGAVSHVVAVEKDARLTRWLEKRLRERGITNVTLVNQDILRCDMGAVMGPGVGKFHVVGNLPYHISSPFLEKLVEDRERLSRAVLMFQLELAKRLIASPGEKAYGALTLLVRYHAEASPLLGVARTAFYPRPQVDAMVVELDFRRPFPRRALSEKTFRDVVKGAFAHRRKTVINSLRRRFPTLKRERLLQVMTDCGIEPGRRAEVLDMGSFLRLADALALTNN